VATEATSCKESGGTGLRPARPAQTRPVRAAAVGSWDAAWSPVRDSTLRSRREAWVRLAPGRKDPRLCLLGQLLRGGSLAGGPARQARRRHASSSGVARQSGEKSQAADREDRRRTAGVAPCEGGRYNFLRGATARRPRRRQHRRAHGGANRRAHQGVGHATCGGDRRAIGQPGRACRWPGPEAGGRGKTVGDDDMMKEVLGRPAVRPLTGGGVTR
jgi:hypothetical protein